MQKYTNCGEQGNTAATELVDEVVEHRARHISRTLGIGYRIALASVRANIQIKEVHHG
jgi:hypothetical protein